MDPERGSGRIKRSKRKVGGAKWTGHALHCTPHTTMRRAGGGEAGWDGGWTDFFFLFLTNVISGKTVQADQRAPLPGPCPCQGAWSIWPFLLTLADGTSFAPRSACFLTIVHRRGEREKKTRTVVIHCRTMVKTKAGYCRVGGSLFCLISVLWKMVKIFISALFARTIRKLSTFPPLPCNDFVLRLQLQMWRLCWRADEVDRKINRQLDIPLNELVATKPSKLLFFVFVGTN